MILYTSTLQSFHRLALDTYRQIDELGEASNFFNSFQWTDQAFRDIEDVNLNGVHFVVCGSEVCVTSITYRTVFHIMHVKNQSLDS